MVRQLQLFKVTSSEKRREVFCRVCHGYPRLCTPSICPLVMKAKIWDEVNKAMKNTKVFGSSPPSAFVGAWGYPRVLMGPLVPPLPHEDTSILDADDKWLGKAMDEIIRYRFSMVRGKSPAHIRSASSPSNLLSVVQTMVMASRPTDVEVWFEKIPNFEVILSPREAPIGPSAPLAKASLAENPRVERRVEKVVGDSDLYAEDGVSELYEGRVPQRQITKLLSMGLLGVRKRRKLVPTEWSITAVDDILGMRLRRKVLELDELSDYLVFGHRALGNNVQVLLLPSRWMFEGFEAWLTSPDPKPYTDHELAMGRKGYPRNLEGAYHASRLPVLEYLVNRARRQAGAMVFMEVSNEWVPLGVWRFREICREALNGEPYRTSSLREAFSELKNRLELPLEKWVTSSKVIDVFLKQERIDGYAKGRLLS